MSKLTKDPLIRRFISLCIFGGAFIWVAVEFFNVEWGVVGQFFLGSIAMVIILIAMAWLASLVLRRMHRRRSSFLDDAGEDEAKGEAATGDGEADIDKDT